MPHSVESEGIQFMKGVGPQTVKRLEKLGIRSISDCLFYFPRTYDDRREVPSIATLKMNETQCCYGAIRHVTETSINRNVKLTKGVISDKTGSIVAIWFNQRFVKRLLREGSLIFIRGKVERNKWTNELQIAVSEFELVDPKNSTIGTIVPVYSLTAGLFQYKLREIVKTSLESCLNTIQDPFPLSLREKLNVLSINSAIMQLHFPQGASIYNKARYRLVFDEFFYMQLAMFLRKHPTEKKINNVYLKGEGDLLSRYLKQLPYQLTKSQQRVIQEIKEDVCKQTPMNRIIQGDVGSGKTDIAIVTLLLAVQAQKKGVLLAPTEILAEQHYYKLGDRLREFNINLILLKGKLTQKQKTHIYKQLSEPGPAIIIGTHAVIVDKVVIADLVLVVVDEQHRFGVLQRLALTQKGLNPHCLYMTATPIPRTLLLTCFGDLDKSIVDELPPGRVPSKTYFLREKSIEKVFRFCIEQLNQNHQVYIVFPLVEESEKQDLKSAVEAYKYLSEHVFSDYKVGLLHGRLNALKKQDAMQKFKQNQIQVLVSTTVIEVGVDVPNATTMVIYHAERFGLSQLHQLRGRIGRGSQESKCFLIGDPKTENGQSRIQALLETTDGFKLAEYDLKIRGPGDVLGTRQAGLPDFKVADLIADESILLKARTEASLIYESDPYLEKPEHSLIKKGLTSKYKFFYDKPLN